MDNSVYIALSRQLTQFQDMSVAANNIANINTPGYNSQRIAFSSFLADAGNGKKDAYADTPTAYRDTSNGPLEVTNNQLDVAIQGQAYFQLQTPLGIRYTKAGNFQLSSEGMVVNSNGYPVLGSDNSPISLPPTAKKIEITSSGQIMVDGSSSGQFGAVEFKNQQAMSRVGNTMFDSQEKPVQSASAHIIQGAIEGSNVNGVTEMTRVLEISRSVDNTSKFITAIYDLEQKGATSLATTKQA